MATTRRRVRFNGTVRGAGGEAECSGWVTEITLPGFPPEYWRYEIDTLSKPLPDGDYTVFAHGKTEPVRRKGGDWVTASAAG